MLDKNVFDVRILPSKHDKPNKDRLRIEENRNDVKRYLELF